MMYDMFVCRRSAWWSYCWQSATRRCQSIAWFSATLKPLKSLLYDKPTSWQYSLEAPRVIVQVPLTMHVPWYNRFTQGP